MAKWIWKFGEFEIYHSLLLHNRRQQYGYLEPVVWKLYAPEPVVVFQKKVTTEGGIFHIHACGQTSTSIQYGALPWEVKKFGGQKDITLNAGTVIIQIRVSNFNTFPCIYVDGAIESDESWEADDLSMSFMPAGTNDMFKSADKTPENFPFSYKYISYAAKEKLENGVLFDFGKETFAGTRFYNLRDSMVRVNFGESREEALDDVWSVIHFHERPKDGTLSYIPYAFRYLFVSDREADVEAQYEYLPLEYRGSFQCDEEIVNQVWDAAAYTFHLNCREFFLDGIKRDRWVWSADAYQSLFVNRYLFFDAEIEKRTLIALGGKAPCKRHINTIMDYTFFWIISLKEYYMTYGDKKFLRQMSPQLTEIMKFCENRESVDGFMRENPGDWIFIDWAPLDKEGALCAEQILYAKALECYADILEVTEESPGMINKSQSLRYREKSRILQKKIQDKFYDREKEVFIDSYESGKQNVSRQSNILAYLFLPCSEQQKENIYKNVILNDEIKQITTPYFKFYENQVHCLQGNDTLLEQSIREYYGSMLKTGATTLYEEYDPEMKGAEHYAMYGNPYEKSLCHAWSASPIYLLGAFRLGVQNTGVAYETFDVRPNPGNLKYFTGTVPVPRGKVEVSVNENEIRVKTDISGGTLRIGGQSWKLKAGKTQVVKLHAINNTCNNMNQSETKWKSRI